MGIQVDDNSLIDVVSLEKRMRSSLNPDFRYSGAQFSGTFEGNTLILVTINGVKWCETVLTQ